MGQLDQHRRQLRQSDGHGHRRDLNRQVRAIAIDDQPAQSVAFAEDQPGRPLGVVVAKLGPQPQCRGQPLAPERLVQRLGRIPSVQADANPAAAVEDATGDELALVREQLDHVAVGRAALDAIHGRIEHPGMPAVKRPRLSRFQDDVGQSGLLQGGEVSGGANLKV